MATKVQVNGEAGRKEPPASSGIEEEEEPPSPSSAADPEGKNKLTSYCSRLFSCFSASDLRVEPQQSDPMVRSVRRLILYDFWSSLKDWSRSLPTPLATDFGSNAFVLNVKARCPLSC